MKGEIFIYEPVHIGLNLVLLPKLMYKLYEVEEHQPVFVEILPDTGSVKAYGRACFEETDENQENGNKDVWPVGLENPLIATCLLSPGDLVEIRELKQSEIKEAASLELEVLGESHSKIQTEQDLQAVKNRILGGEVVLGEESRFIVPLRTAGATHQLIIRVIKAEPQDSPVRCSDQTTIVFKGLSLKVKTSLVSFDSVGGLKKQIKLLREMVQLPMEYPDIFSAMGITPPRGVLLKGPPGNGKTLLARSVAEEVHANFYVVNGPEYVSKFFGEGERKLRETFEIAQLNATSNKPSIIFFDEIDSIAGKRDSLTTESEIKLVAQLLSLMDGLNDRGNVIVIAATNRPNAIDPALRRPGRFDREIEVGLPAEEDRLEILKVHARQIKLAEDVDLQFWAKKTTGYTGADLAALIKEAAMCCLRRVFNLSPDGNFVQKGDVLVTKEDLLVAFKELQPTNLRDLPIQGEQISWDEIIGLKDIKSKLISLIEPPLRDPERLKAMGLIPPPGILLIGSSRSGKKSVILALAKKLGVQCIVVRALDFLNQHSRQQGQTLSEIFRKARLAPTILLIDKIDSVFSTQLKYSSESFLFAEDLVDEIRRNRLYDNVFVVATARARQELPQILLEPSVFGYVLLMPIPSIDECESIIRAKLSNYVSNDADYRELAKLVSGLNSGEVISACEEYRRMSIGASLEFENVIATGFKQAAQITKESKIAEPDDSK